VETHRAVFWGPILFVICINDLREMVASTAKILAHDITIFDSIASEEDHLQNPNPS
jgi:hypothetical protein